MTKYEVEQKFKIRNPGGIRKALKRMGAKLIMSGPEKNELWDYKNMLRKKNSVLRIREAGGRGVLTFKGPRLKSKYKKRIEVETQVDAAAVRQILTTLGYRVRVRYEKVREEYVLRGAHVTIDHLMKFGWFVEIEAPPRRIDVIAMKLGFSRNDREERSYLEMIYGNRSLWAGK